MLSYVYFGTNDPEWDRVAGLHYAADFYAAYVRDPDGNKLAAVCRGITKQS
jgi:hypothetical protein